MGSKEDIERNMRLRMKGVVASQGFSGDKNSKATASAAKAAASKPADQERNRQLRQAENNRYYNDPKARTARANAELDAARKSADRLKPPTAPATSTAPSAKKSAVTRMIEGFKSGAGKGGRIGGLGALRTGGGVPRVK